MVSWIIVILLGALVGWLASIIMRTDAQQGALANIVIGIVGSALGRWLFSGVLGLGSASSAGNSFDLVSLLWGVVGAVVLIAILKAFHVLGSNTNR